MEVVDHRAKSKKSRGAKSGKGGGGGASDKGGDKSLAVASTPADTVTKKVLTVQDGTEEGLTGVGIYFIRTSTKRTLG